MNADLFSKTSVNKLVRPELRKQEKFFKFLMKMLSAKTAAILSRLHSVNCYRSAWATGNMQGWIAILCSTNLITDIFEVKPGHSGNSYEICLKPHDMMFIHKFRLRCPIIRNLAQRMRVLWASLLIHWYKLFQKIWNVKLCTLAGFTWLSAWSEPLKWV